MREVDVQYVVAVNIPLDVFDVRRARNSTRKRDGSFTLFDHPFKFVGAYCQTNAFLPLPVYHGRNLSSAAKVLDFVTTRFITGFDI